MEVNFLKAINHLLPSEGGYVNHPNDKGGETKYGISKKSYPGVDIKNLTREKAIEIYYRDFWKASHANRIPDPYLAYIHFDLAVNSSVTRASRFLKALPKVPFYFEGPPKNKELWDELFNAYMTARKLWYRAIVENDPSQKVFYKGWMNRLKRIQTMKDKRLLG